MLQLQPNFYVIAGAGGNVGVQIGPDGVVIVDTGSAAKPSRCGADSEADQAADPLHHQHQRRPGSRRRQREAVGGRAVDIPTGGLNDIASAGGRAVDFRRRACAVPHERADRQTGRISDRRLADSSYSAALGEDQKDLYLNGEAIQVFAPAGAHTDGDSIVFFRRSDVLVVGDMFDTTRFPVIDLAKGGSVQGVIDSAESH